MACRPVCESLLRLDCCGLSAYCDCDSCMYVYVCYSVRLTSVTGVTNVDELFIAGRSTSTSATIVGRFDSTLTDGAQLACNVIFKQSSLYWFDYHENGFKYDPYNVMHSVRSLRILLNCFAHQMDYECTTVAIGISFLNDWTGVCLQRRVRSQLSILPDITAQSPVAI